MTKNLFLPVRKRIFALLLILACGVSMMACAASNSGSTGSTATTLPSTKYTEPATVPTTKDTEPTTVPAATEPTVPTTTVPPLPEEAKGCDADMLLPEWSESFDPNEEAYFTLPDYPEFEFYRQGGAIYARQKETWRYVLGGLPLFLADLNGDGKREFIETDVYGSGIRDERISVYDLANDMRYTLHERTQYDYSLSYADGKMVAERYTHMGNFYHKDPVNLGKLVIEDGKLFFVSGDVRVEGIVESPLFTEAALQDMFAFVQNYVDWEMHFAIFYRPSINYYLSIYQAAIDPSVVNAEEKRFWIDLGNMQDNEEHLRYLALLELLTGNYIGYSLLEEYVYYDPANPERLFVCTELRDMGYWDVQLYYEDLIAGKCQAHPETYIIHLDHHGIYHWGENTNLYPTSE